LLIDFARQHLNNDFQFFDDGSLLDEFNRLKHDSDDDNDDDNNSNNNISKHNHQMYKPVVFVIDNKNTKQLASLLTAIDAEKQSLCIESYSLYQTSLEEIFLKLASESILEE